jgi:hypothetical protein
MTKRKDDTHQMKPLSLIRIKLSTVTFNELAFAGEQENDVILTDISLWVPEPVLAVAMRDTSASETPLKVSVSGPHFNT